MADQTFKVLTIDDHQDNLITLKALIHEAFPNAVIIPATNGKEGLRLARQEDPDVILLDIVMPGMDGFEVCRRLKHDDALCDIPVVFITALKGDKETRIKALYYGVEAFLSKPIDESELSAQISAMVKIKAGNKQKKMEKAELEEIVAERTKQLEKEFADRIRTEIELHEKEVQYRNLADSGLSLIWTSDTEKLYNYFNKPWLDFTGRTAEQELGNGWAEGVHPDDFQACLNTYVTAFDRREPFQMEYRLRHKSGEYRWINDMGKPNYNSQGEFIGYIGNCFDITEHKTTEQDLILAKEHAEESDRLKTSFLQNMSHEIRTPMNAIIGFSGLLEQTDLSDDDRKKFITIIKNSANQLLSVVTDILIISSLEKKLERININIVSINELLDNLYSIFHVQALDKNIELILNKTGTDPEMAAYTDSTKLTEILTNILSNAIKFTHSGEVEYGYSIKNGFMEFYVKDSGIGISAESQEKIFRRFLQANQSISHKYGGTGLGLSISKGYVELFGGKIWVDSEPGKGSTFRFTIPFISASNILELDEMEASSENFKTVLVAEDEEYNFQYIKHILAKQNVRVIHATTGRQAVEYSEANPQVDLVLMDIKMPEMDGCTAAKLIKSMHPNLPIIAQSAYAMDSEKEQFNGDYFDEYVVKPIIVNELKMKIKKFIEL
jgi:PAS domain S-box-containing protein